MKKNAFIHLMLCMLLVAVVLCAIPGTVKADAVDYTAALQFEEGTTNAVCPVCGEVVAWTAVTQEAYGSAALGKVSGHYYLAEDISYSGTTVFMNLPSKNTLGCFHLNGHNLTATAGNVIGGEGGTLNVIGSGTVAGTRTSWASTFGATVSFNTGLTTGVLNLYSGTYTRTEACGSYPVIAARANKGGVVNVYADAVIDGSDGKYYAAATSGVTLRLIGTTVKGDVLVGEHDGTSVGDLVIDGATVTGNVDQKYGSATISGAAKLGKLTVAKGLQVTLGELAEGTKIPVSAEEAFTAGGMGAYAGYFTVEAGYTVDADASGALYTRKAGVWLVKADGTEETTTNPLLSWITGRYAYIKLYDDVPGKITMPGGQVMVDLNGHDLTVDGTGSATVFDSANDTYDQNACGVIQNQGQIKIAQSVLAPNGGLYITVESEGCVTAHRLDMELTTVTLRTEAAGMYYKANYNCDTVLAQLVESYGVVLSVNNMPGADFMEETADNNRYTVAKPAFRPGITATSGAVTGILKEELKAASNAKRAQIKIYANAYVVLGGNTIVADPANAGKTAEETDFTGTALSLYDVMQKLDSLYSSYDLATRLQLDRFCAGWQATGLELPFENIGATLAAKGVDNSPLQFEEGTTNALCPVCGQVKAWTAITQEAYGTAALGKVSGHYYLAEDITYSGTDSFMTMNAASCFHLNGHDLTATATSVVAGGGGTLNIVGQGTVAGTRTNATGAWNQSLGAVVQFNTSVKTGTLNLFGGTYTRTEACTANPVITAHSSGGVLNVYEGATIDGSDGKYYAAVTYGVPLNLYGATVKGNVLVGYYNANGVGALLAESARISGNVDYKAGSVTLSGAPVIDLITCAQGQLLTVKGLTEGAQVGISAGGVFTEENASVKYYPDYFKPANAADRVTVREHALYCGRDYVSALSLDEEEKAMCPACGKAVAWTAITQETYGSTALGSKGGHFYLAEDITYSGTTSFMTMPGGSAKTCFHLNGHDLTATATNVVNGGGGTLNIMGEGIVAGTRASATGAWNQSLGAAVHFNTSVKTGVLNLYSGTYARTAASAGTPVVTAHSAGGTLNVYEDATIDGSDGKYYAAVTYGVPLNLYGAAVKGDVLVGYYNANGVGTLLAESAKISGNVNYQQGSVTLSGNVQLGKLTVAESMKVVLGELTAGAAIPVSASGVFTEVNEATESYAGYFYPADLTKQVLAQDNALVMQ